MPEDPSQDFGAFLRQARERQGITLRQIADRTKISVPALDALERNDISRLPGGLFSRAFVRAYAREAGLDVEDAVNRFVARFPEASMDEAPVPYQPNPEGIAVDEAPSIGRGWRAVGWALPLLLVIAYFAFGGRAPFWRDQPPPATSTPVAVERPAVPPPPAVEEPPTPTPPQEALQARPGEQAVQPAAGEAGTRAAAHPETVVAVAEAGPPGSGAPAAPPEGALRLVLAPRADCWVSVNAAGQSVFSGLVRGGERRTLGLQGEVVLTVGDAGAFAFTINGEPGRVLGSAGEVKSIRFGPDTFRDYLEVR